MPVKQEFHTKDFITDKNPFHGKFSPEVRRDIIFQYCHLVARLDIRIINVAIDKLKINRPKYNVLKNALTYAVQRIENEWIPYPLLFIFMLKQTFVILEYHGEREYRKYYYLEMTSYC